MIAAAAVTMLAIAVIRRDGGTQFRAALDSTIVEEYAALLRDSDAPGPLPPVVVYYDGSSYWLADGFYRTAACDTIGRTMIPCEVRSGTVRDARLYAATEANRGHGVRMTAAEKRACVVAVLQDEEGRRWSDREIARRCGVHHQMVAGLRQLDDHPVERLGKDGKVRKLPAKAPAQAAQGKVLSDEELADIESRAVWNRLSFDEAAERTRRIVAAGGPEALEADAKRRAEIREAAKEEKRAAKAAKEETCLTKTETTTSPPPSDAPTAGASSSPANPSTPAPGKIPGTATTGSLRDPVPEIAAQARKLVEERPFVPVLFPEAEHDPAPSCAACVETPRAEARNDTPEDVDGLLDVLDKGQEEGEREALAYVAGLLEIEESKRLVPLRQAIAVAIGRLRDTSDPSALEAAEHRGYERGERAALGWVAEHVLALPPFGVGPAAKLRTEIEQHVQALRDALPAPGLSDGDAREDGLLKLATEAARELGRDRGAKAKRDALPGSAYTGQTHLMAAVEDRLRGALDLPYEEESPEARKLWEVYAAAFIEARNAKPARPAKKGRA